MARIHLLPSESEIHGYKGVLDFYLWRGLPVVRKWPYNPKSHHSPATIAAAEKFGAVTTSFHLLQADQLDIFTADAQDHTRTARDIYMTAAYGHLHRITMAEFTDMLQACADSLANLEGLLNALASIDADQLLVDVVSSVLPSGAATETTLATLATETKLETVRTLLASIDEADFATQDTLANLLTELQLKADLAETQPISAASLPLPTGAASTANQETMITALQLIDDLQGALVSVGTDTLKVSGEDQMFSFGEQWLEHMEELAATVGENLLQTSATPAGTVRILTSISAINTVSACTYIRLFTSDGSKSYNLIWKPVSAAAEGVSWQGWIPLTEFDTVKAAFGGCTAGDNIYLDIHGFGMGESGYVPGSWDPSGFEYSDKYIQLDTPNNPIDVSFKPDGTKIFVKLGWYDSIRQATLSTPWDLSTHSSWTGSSLMHGNNHSNGITFKPDGLAVYLAVFDDDTISQYLLGDHWDVTTLVTPRDSSYDLSAQTGSPSDVALNPDGTKMYVLDTAHDTVFQYTMGSPWEVAGSTYDTKSCDVTTEDDVPRGLFFKPDGTRMYILGDQHKRIYLYLLTTPWDVSTAYYSDKFLYVGTQTNKPRGLFITPDGATLYIADETSPYFIRQYEIST